ncbi:FAD-dependent monooxygenase [Candidatus Pelagibacter sp.]|nr:FAD-dependent monooxygenase [Candidatus Pelagibacter sp.]
MKICILGDGLISLTLAKVLIQKDLSVDILSTNKFRKHNQTRTLGISKSNIEYFNKNIINIKKILWEIKNIKIYTENSLSSEILNFTNGKEQIFSILKNHELYKILKKNLQKSKIVKFKKNFNYKNLNKEKYNLIINCDLSHEITKKKFSNKIVKKYNSYAYTTVINHLKIKKNDIATQIFTKNGPIAFLPISNTQTSVVYSHKVNNDNNKIDIKKLIKKFNFQYEINSIDESSKFELRSSNLRKYYKGNILAFGDLLHKIHPLAGQGFNMSLRDIRELSKLIEEKINLGLDLDSSICYAFQEKVKDKNLIFSTSIDWIYELFNFESKTNNQLISKSINIIGKNKFLNSFFKKFADNGLRI